MKYILQSYEKLGAFGLVVLMIFSYACSDLTSYNENENEPSQADIPYLLTNAQKVLADTYWGEFELGYFGNLYAQYWSQNQYTEESRYDFRPGVVNDLWNDYYTTLNTIQQIIRQNRSQPEASAIFGNNANQIAAAKILKAWTFQTLTDIWGDVPFDSTLAGAEKPRPPYTSQEEIYTGIIEMLTEASDSINVDEAAFTSGDIIFGGDASLWKKLANSLKMRAAIRIADANPDLAQTAIQEAEAAGVMTTSDDNALFTYLTATPNNNPINEAYKTREDFAVSNTLVDFMNANGDPRISVYADTAAGGTYVGFPYGMTGGNATVYQNNEPWSAPGARLREATAPAIFMTYSEVLFAEAEAAQRGWISADAASKYEQAIQASMDYWEVSEEDASAYIDNNPYDANNWRENLGRQKWVALYMQGIQGWSLWRRLDFGLFNPPAGGKAVDSFDAPIALRYPYPTDEENLNGDNLQAAIDNQGWPGNNQGQKVWWDSASE